MKILSLLMSFQTHETFVLQKKNNDFSSDTEENKLLNKVIFVFFTRKKYSRSFITLRLNHWCFVDYLNDVLLTTFLGLEHSSSVAVYAGSERSRIS